MSASDILVVDDNADDFFAARRTLSREGLSNPLVHQESAEAALRYLRGDQATRPGLVLMDINMPGMKGTEALLEIRRDPALKDIPVIMLTSSDADRDLLASFQGGAAAYLHKPLTLKSLLDAVGRVRHHRPELQLRMVPQAASIIPPSI